MSDRFDIAADARELLRSAGLDSLDAWLRLRRRAEQGGADACVLSRHDDRVTLSLELPDPAGGPAARLFAKVHFAIPAFPLISAFVRTGARPTAAPVREHAWLARLAMAGIDAMAPVAVGERRMLGLPRAAVLVVRAVPAPTSLFALLRDPATAAATSADSALWGAVGRLVATLHANRIDWPDLICKHLFPRRGPAGWQLFLIDVERMAPASPSWHGHPAHGANQRDSHIARHGQDARAARVPCSVGAFGTLLRTLPVRPSEAAIDAMVVEYCAAGGADDVTVAAMTALVDRLFNRRPAVPPDYWQLQPGGSVCEAGLLVRASWRDALRSAGLTDLDAVFRLESGQSLTKPGLPAHRRRDRIDVAGRAFYLKRYQPGLGRRLARVLRCVRYGGEAADEWHALYRLANGGVPVPEPVLLGESSSRGAARGCVGLGELPDAESLEKWLPRVEPSLRPGERAELFSRLAEFVSHFHSLGTVHRDLYLCHIFIRWQPGQGRPMFWLIDLARVFRPVAWRRRRWVVKDLAQLRHSLGAMISPDEWTAFLASYADGSADPAFARAIETKAARIGRHSTNRLRRHGVGH